jgi:GDPmannose 4,6-dehydratase
MKKALIFGITGQDGAYLSKLLVGEGYLVTGASRDAQAANLSGLTRLGVRGQVEIVSASLADFRAVLDVLSRTRPDEIYNLAGQSSVGLSFDQPMETFHGIALGTLNLLEAVRFLGMPVRIYNACSVECFGDTGDAPADERSPFSPRSPYGVAKAAAFHLCANYREAYNLFACSGILSNHESPLRPERYVTAKIVAAAKRIRAGSGESLRLGNLSVRRDWGYAPEFVRAMWLMLRLDAPRDLVIATGRTFSLEEFAARVFGLAGLDWREHVVIDESLFRPTDIGVNRLDPSLARELLGYAPQSAMPEVARIMYEDQGPAPGH